MIAAYLCALALLTVLAVTPVQAQTLSLLPPPVEAGGAMVVAWNGIEHPTPTDWVGLYAPGDHKYNFIQWLYVGCSQDACHARAAGTCGLPIPGTVLPGPYELRLYAQDGYTLLATSPVFQIGGGQ